MATGVRVAITLACTECKRRNYQTQKSKRNTPDRVEFASTAAGAVRTRSTARRGRPGRISRPWQERRDASGETPGAPRARSRHGRPRRARCPAGPASAAAPVEHARRGGFVRESIAELRKVEWPNRAQVIQGTIVVIIACVIVGAFLWGCDQVLRPFVRDVLLGQ